MVIRHVRHALACVAIMVFGVAFPATAGVVKDAVGGGVAAGGVAGGVEAATLAAQAYQLVVAAVTATTAATTCAQVNCAAHVLAFIDAHPLVGRTVMRHEIKKYANQHPEQGYVVQQIDRAVEQASRRPLDDIGQPIARSIPDPPGDCTPGDHRRMQDEVNKWCKSEIRKCLRTDALDVLAAKLETNRQCVIARDAVNNRCFKGGNRGHRAALQNELDALANCESQVNRTGAAR
jgi:hypothetical protein